MGDYLDNLAEAMADNAHEESDAHTVEAEAKAEADIDADAGPEADAPDVEEGHTASDADEGAEAGDGEPQWQRALRPGETKEDALERLAGVAIGRRSEVEDLRRKMGEMENANKRSLEILHALAQRAQREEDEKEKERLRAETPDPSEDPDGAILHRLDRLGQRIEGFESSQAQERERQRQQQQQQQQQQQLYELDARQFQALQTAMEEDPQVREDYNSYYRLLEGQVTNEIEGEATPQEVAEAVSHIQRIAARQAAARGVSYPDFVRHQVQGLRVALGGGAEGSKSAPSPTPGEVQERAQRRKSVGGARRRTGKQSGGSPGDSALEKFRKMSSKNAVEAALSGKIDLDQLWQQAAEEDVVE